MHPMIRTLLVVAIISVLVFPAYVAAKGHAAPARIFAQQGLAVDEYGHSIPPLVIEPEFLSNLEDVSFDLGSGCAFVLRTNLSSQRRRGAAEIAAVVRRCYEFLEAQTGRRVHGNVLLYALVFDEVPLSYKFQVELDQPGHWSQIRLVLLDEDDELNGPNASENLAAMLYGTLPHELSHQILDSVPTVYHDVDGKASYRTRWFIEGVCETMALQFARHENSAQASRILANHHVDQILDNPVVCRELLGWTQRCVHSYELEAELYGAAMLVVSYWLQHEKLADLLADLSATGGQHDGNALLSRLQLETGQDTDGILVAAAALGRRLLPPAYSVR